MVVLAGQEANIEKEVKKYRGSANCVSNATENIILEVPLKILNFITLVLLAYNGISVKVTSNAPDLECIFRRTWS